MNVPYASLFITTTVKIEHSIYPPSFPVHQCTLFDRFIERAHRPLKGIPFASFTSEYLNNLNSRFKAWARAYLDIELVPTVFACSVPALVDELVVQYGVCSLELFFFRYSCIRHDARGVFGILSFILPKFLNHDDR